MDNQRREPTPRMLLAGCVANRIQASRVRSSARFRMRLTRASARPRHDNSYGPRRAPADTSRLGVLTRNFGVEAANNSLEAGVFVQITEHPAAEEKAGDHVLRLEAPVQPLDCFGVFSDA